jgi:hypothetical protein
MTSGLEVNDYCKVKKNLEPVFAKRLWIASFNLEN